MTLYEGEYTCRMILLPGEVHGVVRLTRDGTDYPNIYINDALSPEARRRAFDHEMRHLENNDFHNDKSIDEIENRREPE